MMGTFDCVYETPCGWCTKWDKKCDKKIPERVLKSKINILDDSCDIKTTDISYERVHDLILKGDQQKL